MTSPTPALCSPRQNRLLAALPAADLAALAPELESVSLKVGETLCGPRGQFHHAYFPTTAIVSLLYLTESGTSCEVAGVGNEGMVGVSLFLGVDTTANAAVVQTAGRAWRLESRLLKREFARAGALQSLLLLYTQALLIQTSQSVVCTRHHSIDQQMCRWLLLTLDRSPCSELLMTQEMIAGMFGVRRESITDAAGKMQRAGLISYRRGHISVLDRAGLEAGACECYALVKNELDRLLPDAR
ncbi:MAG: Crp/Fnr family transcriptional regulator [Arenimonas sp.]|uniref:Crp/Fnr family transcriptional regulator n=1 Tax=Arenimonas sp. TaxID=1872635 RepID=UPI0025C3397A|nr:Crp/Fnr family transcriptional regulator [Arenimonas sp.]MBW8368980.1 Crp/Fnr family transcriptional regulator [Arenimonas sp.]